MPARTPDRGTERPRLVAVDPQRLRPLDSAELDGVLPGDLLEGVAIDAWDVSGRSMTDLAIEESTIDRLTVDDTELRGLRLRDVVIELLDAAVLRAARTTWRGVRVRSGRVGSAELFDTTLENVEFVGLKLGYVNLRGSRLTDVVFRDCSIEELDVDDATLVRVAIEESSVQVFAGAAATVRSVDLRAARIDQVTGISAVKGATISEEQVWSLAPVFAQDAGFRIG